MNSSRRIDFDLLYFCFALLCFSVWVCLVSLLSPLSLSRVSLVVLLLVGLSCFLLLLLACWLVMLLLAVVVDFTRLLYLHG